MGCKKLTYFNAGRALEKSSLFVVDALEKKAPFAKRNIKAYPYGFNGMEKDDEVKGSGNSYDFGSRIHDPRLGRFLSIDPRVREFPFWAPYLFAANDPIRFIDIDGEGPGDKVRGPRKRNKPKINNKFNGGGLVGLLGGLRGKYLKHNTLTSQRNPNPPIAGSSYDGVRETGSENETPNGLERTTPPRDNANGTPVEFKPKKKEGVMVVEFDPGVDEDGNPVEKTIEIGTMDKDGNKTPLNTTTSDQPSKLESDYKLKKGETLYKIESYNKEPVNGNTTTGVKNKKK